MEWVARFIHLFGGDKAKVSIFGCSAGAASVSVQYVMRRTYEHKLFRAAIAESGAFAQWASQPMAVAEAVFATFATHLGCDEADIACMRAANATAVRDATANVLPSQHSVRHNPFAPVVDGVELAAEAWQLARSGVRAPVPLILGSNRDEMSATYFYTAPFDLNATGLQKLVGSLAPIGGSEAATRELLSLYPISEYPHTECCTPQCEYSNGLSPRCRLTQTVATRLAGDQDRLRLEHDLPEPPRRALVGDARGAGVALPL